MNTNFYSDGTIDLRYPEIGICMEDTTGPYAKIAIPIATPTLPLDQAYDNIDLAISTQNIVSNTESMYITPCTTSNYISIKLPSNMTSLSRGDNVILIFIGGDINKPVILRWYED